MAGSLVNWIQGVCISGDERIYPNDIHEPPQDNVRTDNSIYFTHLVKGVTDYAKKCIIRHGGFKGNRKKFGEDNNGESLYGTFSWWSVYIDDENARRIKSEMSHGQEPAPIYEEGSRYGTNLYIEALDKLISMYEESIEGESEIRVLATYEYTREVMHALVVAPRKNELFKDHDLVAEREEDGNYIWFQDQQRIIEPNDESDDINDDSDDSNDDSNEYIWHPFSTVQWDNYARPPKERQWTHLAFAFYLDPLPNKFMPVSGVVNDSNWIECNWQYPPLDTEYESQNSLHEESDIEDVLSALQL